MHSVEKRNSLKNRWKSEPQSGLFLTECKSFFLTMYPVCFYLAILKSLKLLLNFTGKSRGIAVRFVLRVSCALYCYRFLKVALLETSTSRVFVDTTYLPLDVVETKNNQ